MPAIITRINQQTNNKILLPVITTHTNRKEKQRQKTNKLQTKITSKQTR